MKAKQMIQKAMGLALMLVLLMSSISGELVGAQDHSPMSMHVSVEDGRWLISGSTYSDSNVSILIHDGNQNIRYIDQQKSDSRGLCVFGVPLDPLSETDFYSIKMGVEGVDVALDEVARSEMRVSDLIISRSTDEDNVSFITATSRLSNLSEKEREAWLVLEVHQDGVLMEVRAQKGDSVQPNQAGSISIEYIVPSSEAVITYRALVCESLPPVEPIGEAVVKRPKSMVNPYEAVDWGTYGQYKANLHTHTTRSDGGYSPYDMINTYYTKGYSVLALTDHDYQNNAAREHVTYPWTEFGGPDPQILGMIAVQGQEISNIHHLLSLFSDYPGNGTTSVSTALQDIGSRGGIAVWAHPRAFGYSVDWYVDHYRQHDHLVGMEAVNQRDRYGGVQNRELWDQVLTRLVPERVAWGFANDDAHNTSSSVETSWNVLLLDELTDEAVRSAVENGQFYFCSKYTISESPSGVPPSISSVEVNGSEGTITILGENYNTITWVSEGNVIHTGKTLNYENLDTLGKYIRAVLTGYGGEAFTQPFVVVDQER